MLLGRIDFSDMTVTVDGTRYALNDHDFPTINPEHPYDLTPGEAEVMAQLIYSFTQSEKLQRHVKFLFSRGSLYVQRKPAVPRMHPHDGGRFVLRI